MTSQPVQSTDVMVGSYSLETLTTGMYENPLHCVREYVQNGFDAIREARSAGVLGDCAGQVSISITGSAKRPTLTIDDDGIGLAGAEAVSALVSVGASRKRSNLNAGFRGIGRLAGVAYCGTLRFTTTVKGEGFATVVEFDCGRMKGFMRPSAEWQDVRTVIQACATTSQVPASEGAHGTKVEMIGLAGIGLEFAEIGRLVPYLRQVCPTDYSDRFTFAERIRSYAAGFGQPIPTVEVETRYKRERTQILKAYDDATNTSKPKMPSTVTDVEMVGSAELGWFGWIGKSNFKGELTDDTVAGVRFRVKNIQIDGSDLIEALAAELTTGGTEGRLQRYAVGEVFITNPAVVPNARRDGFEDGKAWSLIRADVKQKVAKRVIALVRAASTSRTRLKTIAKEIAALKAQLEVTSVSVADGKRIAKLIDSLLSRLRPDKLTGGDPDQVGNYVSQVKTLREKLKELQARSEAGGSGADTSSGAGGEGGEGGGTSEEGGEDEDDDGAQDGDGEAEDDGARDGGGRWTADEVLESLRAVMTRELGPERTEALFDLAFDRLEDG